MAKDLKKLTNFDTALFHKSSGAIFDTELRGKVVDGKEITEFSLVDSRGKVSWHELDPNEFVKIDLLERNDDNMNLRDLIGQGKSSEILGEIYKTAYGVDLKDVYGYDYQKAGCETDYLVQNNYINACKQINEIGKKIDNEVKADNKKADPEFIKLYSRELLGIISNPDYSLTRDVMVYKNIVEGGMDFQEATRKAQEDINTSELSKEIAMLDARCGALGAEATALYGEARNASHFTTTKSFALFPFVIFPLLGRIIFAYKDPEYLKIRFPFFKLEGTYDMAKKKAKEWERVHKALERNEHMRDELKELAAKENKNLEAINRPFEIELENLTKETDELLEKEKDLREQAEELSKLDKDELNTDENKEKIEKLNDEIEKKNVEKKALAEKVNDAKERQKKALEKYNNDLTDKVNKIKKKYGVPIENKEKNEKDTKEKDENKEEKQKENLEKENQEKENNDISKNNEEKPNIETKENSETNEQEKVQKENESSKSEGKNERKPSEAMTDIIKSNDELKKEYANLDRRSDKYQKDSEKLNELQNKVENSDGKEKSQAKFDLGQTKGRLEYYNLDFEKSKNKIYEQFGNMLNEIDDKIREINNNSELTPEEKEMALAEQIELKDIIGDEVKRLTEFNVDHLLEQSADKSEVNGTDTSEKKINIKINNIDKGLDIVQYLDNFLDKNKSILSPENKEILNNLKDGFEKIDKDLNEGIEKIEIINENDNEKVENENTSIDNNIESTETISDPNTETLLEPDYNLNIEELLGSTTNDNEAYDDLLSPEDIQKMLDDAKNEANDTEIITSNPGSPEIVDQDLLKNLQAENDNLKKEVYDLNGAIESLKSDLNKKDAEIYDLDNKIDVLSNDLSQKETLVNELSNEKEQLLNDKNALEIIVNNNDIEISDLTQKLENANLKIDDYEKAIDLLKYQKEELTTEQENLKAKLQESEDKITDLTKNLENLQQEKNELNDKNNELQEKINSLENNLNNEIAEKEALMQKNAELQNDKNALEQNIANKEQEISDLKNETEKLKGDLVEKEKENLDLNNKIETLDNKVNELESSLENEKDKVDKLTKERDNLSVENENLKNEKNSLEVSLKEKENLIENLNGKIENLNDKIDNLENSLNGEKEKNNELSKENNDLKNEKQTLENSLKEKNTELEKVGKEFEGLQKSFEKLNDALEDKDIENQKLKGDISSLNAKVENLQNNNSELQHENKNLEIKNNNLEKENNDLSKENKALEVEYDKKVFEIDKLKEKIANLETKLDNEIEKTNKLEKDNQDLKDKNTELTEALNKKEPGDTGIEIYKGLFADYPNVDLSSCRTVSDLKDLMSTLSFLDKISELDPNISIDSVSNKRIELSVNDVDKDVSKSFVIDKVDRGLDKKDNYGLIYEKGANVGFDLNENFVDNRKFNSETLSGKSFEDYMFDRIKNSDAEIVDTTTQKPFEPKNDSEKESEIRSLMYMLENVNNTQEVADYVADQADVSQTDIDHALDPNVDIGNDDIDDSVETSGQDDLDMTTPDDMSDDFNDTSNDINNDYDDDFDVDFDY